MFRTNLLIIGSFLVNFYPEVNGSNIQQSKKIFDSDKCQGLAIASG